MSLFKSLFRAARATVHAVDDIPFAGKALKMLPVVGNALSAIDLGMNAVDMFSGRDSGGMPSILPSSGGGLPPLLSGGMVGGDTGGAMVPYAGGASNAMTVAPGLPTTTAQFQQWEAAGLLVGNHRLRVSHRAPKGYVVVHVNGTTFALRKDVARKFHLTRVHHKPPISVGEWHALQKSHHVIKKMKKVDKMVHALARRAVRGTGVAAHHSHGGKKHAK